MDSGAPKQDEVARITNVIMTQLGDCDLESALTVLCGIAGQCVAVMSEGKPALVKRHSEDIAENIKRAAYTRQMADVEKRRNEDG